ncbi:MAG: phosphohistidine phosphatase SixA [Planctomycetes bacterium]|nr:phosphohistidine phosphatase SixA [Planctomycetota bacterium]
MELYLIRHAHAVALGEQGITTDAERPLSEKGEAQAEAAAKTLAQRGVMLDKLFTSPLLRTRQTAEILLRVWSKPELILETCDALAPGGKPRKLSKQLLKAGVAKVGLVGHMPDLGIFAGWLLGAKKAQIDFDKAGVALIACDDLPVKGMGTLQWLVTPQWY